MADLTPFQRMAIKNDDIQKSFREDLKKNNNRSTSFHKIIDCLTGDIYHTNLLSHVDEEKSVFMFFKPGSKKSELITGPTLKNARLLPTLKEIKAIYFDNISDAEFLIRLGIYVKEIKPTASGAGFTDMEEIALQFCSAWKNRKTFNGKKWVDIT